ncbi:GAF domain-containing protein [Thalassorhabdus alkalitolerans]|uniref:GAF domain-containing protein n=1 Tax=Thalassorhabdus alkalitolerans TaxID=2282697 RepID=A0ABW0YRR0_9BACI|nr:MULTISPECIES: GAF domain-containing protein [Bacillaceae]
MSIATDVASIHIMAAVYKKDKPAEIFKETVERLVEHVPYIDWCGVYVGENEQWRLMASASEENNNSWEHNGQLSFSLKDLNGKEVGILVVKSKEPIAFDVTDVSTLETVADALSQQITMN